MSYNLPDTKFESAQTMSAISQGDYEAVLACINRLYDCDRLEQFPHIALTEIPRLVGADHVTFNYVALSVPKVVVLAHPQVADHPRKQRTFSRYVGDHPVQYGVESERWLNRFFPRQRRGSTRLPETVTEWLQRAKNNRERRNRWLDPNDTMVRERGGERLRLRVISGLSSSGRILVWCSRNRWAFAARSFLAKRDASDAHIPQWICKERATKFGQKRTAALRVAPHLACGVVARVVKYRCGYTLTLAPSHRPNVAQQMPTYFVKTTLVMGLETIATAAHALKPCRLTEREIEILLQIEQGKTNDETAATLGISPLTVRTHLEHIFEKLNVVSRTAAVMKFHHLCHHRSH